jgi:hypothetical protein
MPTDLSMNEPHCKPLIPLHYWRLASVSDQTENSKAEQFWQNRVVVLLGVVFRFHYTLVSLRTTDNGDRLMSPIRSILEPLTPVISEQ